MLTDLCPRVVLVVPPCLAVGASAVAPDPGDGARRADGAAAL